MTRSSVTLAAALAAALGLGAGASAQDPNNPPPPFQTPSASNGPSIVPKPAGAELMLPPGFTVEEWARGLSGPRTLMAAPNGDLFVAEYNGGRVSVYPGMRPGEKSVFASGLRRPFGLAFHGDSLYVGTEDAVLRYAYQPGQLQSGGAPERVLSLPTGGHTTRNVTFSPDGAKMYIAIGSAGNVGEEAPPRATIQEANPDGSGQRTFASGLRNPVGLAWNPVTGKLWTVVNERDGLGDDVPPDYATSVSDGDFYGWPYAYFDGRPDPHFGSLRPDLVAKTRKPDVPIQAHSAPLGIAFYTGAQFPQEYRGDAFITLHGSWNRARKTGYKVIRVPFGDDGLPSGPPEDFLTGWLWEGGTSQQVWGRPVGVTTAPDGSLLVSDDGAGRIWRVTYQPPLPPGSPGDVDEDGRVTVQDVLYVLRAVAGLTTLSPVQTFAADVAPSGAPDQQVTILDVVALLKMLVNAP